MKKYRKAFIFEDHLTKFTSEIPEKARHKIMQAIEVLENLPIIPTTYLKHIEGSKGLYEIRIDFGSNAYRVFCFFDSGKLIIILNGFSKKTQRTPINEIIKALKLKQRYYDKKRNER